MFRCELKKINCTDAKQNTNWWYPMFQTLGCRFLWREDICFRRNHRWRIQIPRQTYYKRRHVHSGDLWRRSMYPTAGRTSLLILRNKTGNVESFAYLELFLTYTVFSSVWTLTLYLEPKKAGTEDVFRTRWYNWKLFLIKMAYYH